MTEATSGSFPSTLRPSEGVEYARHPFLAEYALLHEHNHNNCKIEALSAQEPHKQQEKYRKYSQNLRGALKRIRVAATETIIEDDLFGLEALVSRPSGFDFPRDGQKEVAFREWLDGQLDRDILQEHGGQNTYISSAYQRGLVDADTDLRSAGIADPSDDISTVMNIGIHEDTLESLYERNFRALEGFNAELGNDLSRELLDGFSEGEGPRQIAGRIQDTVGRASDGVHTGYAGRATTIARTEVMRANHVSTINRFNQFGVQQVTLLLAPDACDICTDLKSQAPFPVTDAMGLLPAHPNCRCAVTIAT